MKSYYPKKILSDEHSSFEFFTNLPHFINTFKLFLEIGGSAQSCRGKFISIIGFIENSEQLIMQNETVGNYKNYQSNEQHQSPDHS